MLVRSAKQPETANQKVMAVHNFAGVVVLHTVAEEELHTVAAEEALHTVEEGLLGKAAAENRLEQDFHREPTHQPAEVHRNLKIEMAIGKMHFCFVRNENSQ